MFALWALRVHPYRPEARTTPPPRKPFILMNPKSGGGKVRTFNLDGVAREMGAEVSYLEPGVDVADTLERAVKDGADLLGAAGGDGTQAMVAEVAAKHDLPILCIPAGTRNHFALDLGLDRDDPSLALRALGNEGEEVLIDLGRVGDRPFVNNVSLGVYAEIVARPEYRDAKIQTALEVLPKVTKPDARSGLTVEASGRESVADPQVVQVSNNPYARPEEPAPSGTRPRLDTGSLGIEIVAYKDAGELRQTVAHATRGTLARAKAYQTWTSDRVMITSNDGVVPAGSTASTSRCPPRSRSASDRGSCGFACRGTGPARAPRGRDSTAASSSGCGRSFAGLGPAGSLPRPRLVFEAPLPVSRSAGLGGLDLLRELVGVGVDLAFEMNLFSALMPAAI